MPKTAKITTVVNAMPLSDNGMAGYLFVPKTIVEFDPEVLTVKELAHARLTARACFNELVQYAKIMVEKSCTYTNAVVWYHKEVACG